MLYFRYYFMIEDVNMLYASVVPYTMVGLPNSVASLFYNAKNVFWRTCWGVVLYVVLLQNTNGN